MAVLSWGKPKVEFAPSTAGAAGTVFTAFPTIKEGTAQLTPTKGNKQEATGEGGEKVDVRYGKNSYAFACQIFVKKGDTRPFNDNDGVISGNYSVRLTPEDDTLEGFIMDNCAVSVEEVWSSAEGKLLTYTFDGLKPASGNIVKPYVANGLTVTPTALYFDSAADATGKTITATSTGDVSATSSESWATVTCAAKVATVKVSLNDTSAVRTAVITLTADGKSTNVLVTQIP